jgi:hypothetical protein
MPIVHQEDDCCVISNFCKSMASQNNVPQRSSVGFELSFGHNKLIKLILASGHNEPSGLINGLVGHSKLVELSGLVDHHKLIKLINGLVGYIKLTELISLVLYCHIHDFQQGAASLFNDGCLHRLIVVSVSGGAQQGDPTQQATSFTILKLIDAFISEGARFDLNLY